VEDALHRAQMSVQPLKNADTLACPGDPAMPTDPKILKAFRRCPRARRRFSCDPASRLRPVLPRPASPAMPAVPIASL